MSDRTDETSDRAQLTPGSRIRARRKELGLTLDEVAKRVGVTKSAVSQWELGTNKGPIGVNLVKVAAALHASPEELIGHTSAPQRGLVVDRLSRVIELLDAIPDDRRRKLSAYDRAKLIAFLYSADLDRVRAEDVPGLLQLLR